MEWRKKRVNTTPFPVWLCSRASTPRVHIPDYYLSHRPCARILPYIYLMVEPDKNRLVLTNHRIRARLERWFHCTSGDTLNTRRSSYLWLGLREIGIYSENLESVLYWLMPYLCIHRHKGDEDKMMKETVPSPSLRAHSNAKGKGCPRARAIRIALLPGDRVDRGAAGGSMKPSLFFFTALLYL